MILIMAPLSNRLVECDPIFNRIEHHSNLEAHKLHLFIKNTQEFFHCIFPKKIFKKSNNGGLFNLSDFPVERVDLFFTPFSIFGFRMLLEILINHRFSPSHFIIPNSASCYYVVEDMLASTVGGFINFKEIY